MIENYNIVINILPLKFVLFCMETEWENLKYINIETLLLVTFCNSMFEETIFVEKLIYLKTALLLPNLCVWYCGKCESEKCYLIFFGSFSLANDLDSCMMCVF